MLSRLLRPTRPKHVTRELSRQSESIETANGSMMLQLGAEARRPIKRPTPQRRAHPRCCRLDGHALKGFQPLLGAESAERLRELGVETVGQLLGVSSKRLAKELGGGSQARLQIRRWRCGLRLLAELPCLGAADAALLLAVHRRSAAELAFESPNRLYADIRRWSQSSLGNRRLRKQQYRVPTAQQISHWVLEARRRFAAA